MAADNAREYKGSVPLQVERPAELLSSGSHWFKRRPVVATHVRRSENDVPWRTETFLCTWRLTKHQVTNDLQQFRLHIDCLHNKRTQTLFSFAFLRFTRLFYTSFCSQFWLQFRIFFLPNYPFSARL